MSLFNIEIKSFNKSKSVHTVYIDDTHNEKEIGGGTSYGVKNQLLAIKSVTKTFSLIDSRCGYYVGNRRRLEMTT